MIFHLFTHGINLTTHGSRLPHFPALSSPSLWLAIKCWPTLTTTLEPEYPLLVAFPMKWGSLSCPVRQFIDANCVVVLLLLFLYVLCANLLMRLAHISICLMNCYRIHSFPFSFPYSHSHSHSLIHLPSSLLGHLSTFVFWLGPCWTVLVSGGGARRCRVVRWGVATD